MNLVVLIGNLGADPEIRYLPSGTQIARMRLAVNEFWNDRNTGERHQKTHWITLSAFGRIAERCQKFLKKGQRIGVSGSLDYQEWSDRDGNRRTKIEVRIRELEMLSIRSQDEQNQYTINEKAHPSSDVEKRNNFQASSEDNYFDGPENSLSGDDEIPF